MPVNRTDRDFRNDLEVFGADSFSVANLLNLPRNALSTIFFISVAPTGSVSMRVPFQHDDTQNLTNCTFRSETFLESNLGSEVNDEDQSTSASLEVQSGSTINHRPETVMRQSSPCGTVSSISPPTLAYPEIWSAIFTSEPLSLVDLLVRYDRLFQGKILTYKVSCRLVNRRWYEFITSMMTIQPLVLRILVGKIQARVPLAVGISKN